MMGRRIGTLARVAGATALAVLIAGCGSTVTLESRQTGFDEAVYLDDLQYCRAKHEPGGGDIGEGLLYFLAAVAPTEGINRLDVPRTRPNRDMLAEDGPHPTPVGSRLEDIRFERDDRVESGSAEAVAGCLRDKGYDVRVG